MIATESTHVRLLAAILVLLIAALAATGGSAAAREGGAGKPNFVFILTDDMRTDDLDHMPMTRSFLAEQGTTFSNAFVSYPTCCPSRSSILRGQYARNHGVLGNGPPDGGFQKFHELGLESSTVATWLDDAGYSTGLFGKYLNNYPEGADPSRIPPGWDEWFARLGPNDEYSYYDYDMNKNGRVVHYGESEDDYSTDVLSREARDYMSDSIREGQPFFAYISPTAPHSPATPAARHTDEFKGLEAPRVPSFDEPGVGDKPQWIQNTDPMDKAETEETDRIYRERLRTLQAVDEMVANVVRSLRERGEMDNTYIVFTSDNGFHLGEHRLTIGKRTPYEEAIRVPLIVRGPGVPAGETRDEMTLNTDFAPTFDDLGGADAPGFVDGRSLAPLLTRREPESWRTAFLIENYFGTLDEPSGKDNLGIRTIGGDKYVEYANGARELYDLSSNPYEVNNLHESADPALVERLKARLEALKNCAGESCRAAEDGRSEE